MNVLTLLLWLLISLVYLTIGQGFARKMHESMIGSNPSAAYSVLVFAVNALSWPFFAVGIPLCALTLSLVLVTLSAVLRVSTRIGQIVAVLPLSSLNLLSLVL